MARENVCPVAHKLWSDFFAAITVASLQTWHRKWMKTGFGVLHAQAPTVMPAILSTTHGLELVEELECALDSLVMALHC